MPKRTNDFQRLVRLVQQALAPKGATVTESKLVDNAGTIREIDVLVEGDFGIYRMKIAVEAKDHSRALDVTVIEQIASKYRAGDGILVNLVVIVSRSGYTKAAAEKAKRSNIELLTLREAESKDWANSIPAGNNQTIRFTMEPIVTEVHIDPTPDVDERELIKNGRLICTCCDRDDGTVLSATQKFMTAAMSDPIAQVNMRKGLALNNGRDSVTLTVGCSHRAIKFKDRTFPVTKIIARADFADATAPVTIKTYEQLDSKGGRKLVRHAVANVAGKHIEMVLPDDAKPDKIVIDMTDASGGSEKVA